MIVGGSFATLLQVVILGALISKFGNKRTGINAWEPNKELPFSHKSYWPMWIMTT